MLAQPAPVAHVGSHLAMLRQAISEHDPVKIVGQLVRSVVAAPPSLVNRYPSGNTGRARVRLRATMPIPDDLEALLPGR